MQLISGHWYAMHFFSCKHSFVFWLVIHLEPIVKGGRKRISILNAIIRYSVCVSVYKWMGVYVCFFGGMHIDFCVWMGKITPRTELRILGTIVSPGTRCVRVTHFALDRTAIYIYIFGYRWLFHTLAISRTGNQRHRASAEHTTRLTEKTHTHTNTQSDLERYYVDLVWVPSLPQVRCVETISRGDYGRVCRAQKLRDRNNNNKTLFNGRTIRCRLYGMNTHTQTYVYTHTCCII